MAISRLVFRIFEKLTGRMIVSSFPFGNDPFNDIRKLFKNYQFDVIFDIGANEGQTALKLIKKFPESNIWSFEPSHETFEILKNSTEAFKNIQVFNMAVGEKNGEARLIHSSSSDRNYMENMDEHTDHENKSFEVVEMETLTRFCENNSVKHINYLKVDTEGYDLKVLLSAENMLINKSIDFIEVEVGMNVTNTFHVPFEDVKQYLEANKYYLFGIYEQVQEWMIRKPILRRCNMVFVSDKIASKVNTANILC